MKKLIIILMVVMLCVGLEAKSFKAPTNQFYGRVQMDSTLITTKNVGAKTDSVTTATEYGNSEWHKTELTIAGFQFGDIAGTDSLGLGQKIYTFPAGSIIVKSTYMSIALQQTDSHVTADTPEIGLGTVVASGVIDVLTGTFENILTGQAADDCDGTAEVKTVADQILVIESGDAHTVYLNIADVWAVGGDDKLGCLGTVVIEWVFVK